MAYFALRLAKMEMFPMEVSVAWHNLEQAIAAVERGEDRMEHLLATVRAGIYILFEYPTTDIMAQAQASYLPLRPTVSWLVFEASRIKDIPDDRVEELKCYWQQNHADCEGELIPPPPSQLGF
jgi:hypothetical protein